MRAIKERLAARTVINTEVTSPHVDSPCHICDYSRASRVAFEEYITEIPDGLQVLHHCDCGDCVNTDHLWLGTPADNMEDRDAKGRQVTPKGDLNGSRTCPGTSRGVRNGSAKLTEEGVRYIRMWASEGFSQQKIADAFGVNQPQISKILAGDLWKHVL